MKALDYKMLQEIRNGKTEQRQTLNRELFAALGLVDVPSRAGVVVNEEQALTLSALYCGARCLSESVACMPLKLYERTEDDGREEAREHPLWPILRDEVNPEMSTLEFIALMQLWAVVWGTAYAEIERDGAGRCIGLHPIPPWQVRAGRTATGSLAYEVHTNGMPVTYSPADLVIIKGPSPDGSEGYKLARLARESLGFSIACERYGSAYFGNMTRLGGTLETPQQLSDNARENLRKSWSQAYQGVDRTGAVALLEEGLQFKAFTSSNEQSEYNATRTQQQYSVCQWLRIDPIFLYLYDRATWNNGELQSRNFLQFSLNPWLCKWESEIGRKMILRTERARFYAEFLRSSVVQMDTKTQHEVWEIGKRNGWYDNDEIRKWLNLKPLPEPKPELPQTPPTQEPPAKESDGEESDTNADQPGE